MELLVYLYVVKDDTFPLVSVWLSLYTIYQKSSIKLTHKNHKQCISHQSLATIFHKHYLHLKVKMEKPFHFELCKLCHRGFSHFVHDLNSIKILSYIKELFSTKISVDKKKIIFDKKSSWVA